MKFYIHEIDLDSIDTDVRLVLHEQIDSEDAERVDTVRLGEMISDHMEDLSDGENGAIINQLTESKWRLVAKHLRRNAQMIDDVLDAFRIKD
jgi:hypothetical protein